METCRIVMTAPGAPEVLRFERVPLAPPGPGEVLLRQTAIGLNYIDIQHRTGRYPLPPLADRARGRRRGRGDGSRR